MAAKGYYSALLIFVVVCWFLFVVWFEAVIKYHLCECIWACFIHLKMESLEHGIAHPLWWWLKYVLLWQLFLSFSHVTEKFHCK